MKLAFLLIGVLTAGAYYIIPKSKSADLTNPVTLAISSGNEKEAARISNKASMLKSYAANRGFSTRYSFLIDMRLPSGRKRFFIYDLVADSILHSGLVAHGSCVTPYLEKAQFSNVTGGGCSSAGRYRVGYSYTGRFGKSYKLFGLDSTNSNAFRRAVVLHAYKCVPDSEVYPQQICNSLGCPMVSPRFLKLASRYIDASEKPLLLWIFD